MANSKLFPTNLAHRQYSRALSNAWRRRDRINDPDYAHVQDKEAWIKIRRDATVWHLIKRRLELVAGLEWRVEPASEDEADVLIAQWQEEILKNVKKFHEARKLLATAIFRGSAYSEVVGQRRPLKLVGTSKMQKYWVPTELNDIDPFRWELRPEHQLETDGKILARWYFWSVQNEKWEPVDKKNWFVRHVVNDTEVSLGYGQGLMETMYITWKALKVAEADGLAGLKRWAQGWVHVKVNDDRIGQVGDDNEAIRDEFIDELKRQMSEHILATASSDDVEVLEGSAHGHQLVDFWLNYLNDKLERLILSSRMPTGGGGDVGGLGGNRAIVEETQMTSTIQADRLSLSESISDSVCSLIFDRNKLLFADLLRKRGLKMGRPGVFKIQEEQVIDPEQGVTQVVSLLSAGVPLMREDIEAKTGWRVASAEDIEKGHAVKVQTQAQNPYPMLSALDRGIDLTPDDIYNSLGANQPRPGEPTVEIPEEAKGSGSDVSGKESQDAASAT